jgi:hypothetical protein
MHLASTSISPQTKAHGRCLVQHHQRYSVSILYKGNLCPARNRQHKAKHRVPCSQEPMSRPIQHLHLRSQRDTFHPRLFSSSHYQHKHKCIMSNLLHRIPSRIPNKSVHRPRHSSHSSHNTPKSKSLCPSIILRQLNQVFRLSSLQFLCRNNSTPNSTPTISHRVLPQTARSLNIPGRMLKL